MYAFMSGLRCYGTSRSRWTGSVSQSIKDCSSKYQKILVVIKDPEGESGENVERKGQHGLSGSMRTQGSDS